MRMPSHPPPLTRETSGLLSAPPDIRAAQSVFTPPSGAHNFHSVRRRAPTVPRLSVRASSGVSSPSSVSFIIRRSRLFCQPLFRPGDERSCRFIRPAAGISVSPFFPSLRFSLTSPPKNGASASASRPELSPLRKVSCQKPIVSVRRRLFDFQTARGIFILWKMRRGDQLRLPKNSILQWRGARAQAGQVFCAIFTRSTPVWPPHSLTDRSPYFFSAPRPCLRPVPRAAPCALCAVHPLSRPPAPSTGCPLTSRPLRLPLPPATFSVLYRRCVPQCPAHMRFLSNGRTSYNNFTCNSRAAGIYFSLLTQRRLEPSSMNILTIPLRGIIAIGQLGQKPRPATFVALLIT